MLKFNIYITCISILKYNKKGKLTSIKTRSYYRKESAASALRNQKQPRSQAQQKAWERGWNKSTPKGSKAACTIC